MPLAEEIISGRNSIQAYQPDQLTINERVYSQSLVLSASDIITPWPVQEVANLEAQNLQQIVELEPEVILLGTGEKQVFPDIEVLGYFAQLGIGIEVMTTGAACRTFNILVAEDRKVVAALILSANV